MKEQFSFYAIPGDDGLPRVGHFVVGQQPDGAIEVTEGHAAQLSADVRAREEKRERRTETRGNYVTPEQAEKIAKAQVEKFASEIFKSAGGGNADK